eukprot:CAMPEP_0181325830 /NCGR_PEP_ID=MMETSP1101-20121128/21151_1 /TAXON_ID=46948 /ORGANISM="Rhodomonas abbreviata, Strain Caron Lab Isolate" /LENGTH=279 /DNA_ID=CAMNT_0023434197 /DNA_START=25 /DNA_END=861 /DNA_ORIENTATION=-
MAATGDAAASKQPSADDFLKTSNGRFDALPADADLNDNWKDAMADLARRQAKVGRKPVLAIWVGDVAKAEQQEKLVEVVIDFLDKVHPRKLLMSGRRAPSVADQAEQLMRRALGSKSWKPETLIAGGADGVDSVALRLTDKSGSAIPDIKVKGYYTPTKFARADAEGKMNPKPMKLEDFDGLQEGPSPLQNAEKMSLPEAGSNFGEFLSLMEGQWEARDTWNAEHADAVIAFLTADGRTTHDGTKATLNIFAEGRYAHPLEGSTGTWEVEAATSLSGAE